jgi:hypothetical protein
MKKVIMYVIAILVIAVALLLVYVKSFLPDVGAAPELVIEVTPEKVDRGEYLAHHVMVCMDCHSTRDWNLFSGPPVAGTNGKGGEVFDQNMGFPGKYIAPNVTPFALGNWTDGEIFRAITTGVSKDGRALFPIMPYHYYGQLDRLDIEAVIAYLRTLPPIESEPEKSVSDFPMSFILNTLPKPAEFKPVPSKSDVVSYGEYMTMASGCIECHTKQEKGKIVGEAYAGGFEFKFPDGSILRSSNITPHAETGIGRWTKEQFVEKFTQFADSTYTPDHVPMGEFQTVMPWTMYGGMKVEDLEAIYAYLQSISPVENEIARFSPANAH